MMVTLPLGVSADDVTGLLGHTGLLGSWEEEGLLHLYWEQSQWQSQYVNLILEAVKQLGQAIDSQNIMIQKLPWEDWNRQWTQQVKPVWIGRHIVVRPSWEPVALPPDSIELIIDPNQAFGTGHHATTSLLAEWLEELVKGGERVLDVGTGSGVLAMIALRLGAGSAVGLDCDPIAIECAKNYASINRFKEEFCLKVGRLKDLPKEPYDLILANLDRRNLLASVHQFGDFCGWNTQLLLSGLLREDRQDLVRKFSEAGWKENAFREREEWVALSLTPEKNHSQ